MFARNYLLERKIESCRKSSKSYLEFKKNLGLDINSVTCDEQDIISRLQTSFEGEIIVTQYCIKNKRLDAYFPNYKLTIEVDEYNHEDRDSNYEKNRKSMTEDHGIAIIRTNPDAADFNINKLINQIYRHISQSNKLKLKKGQVKIKKQEDKNKELEDKIEKLKLQLVNLDVKNNEVNDKK